MDVPNGIAKPVISDTDRIAFISSLSAGGRVDCELFPYGFGDRLGVVTIGPYDCASSNFDGFGDLI